MDPDEQPNSPEPNLPRSQLQDSSNKVVQPLNTSNDISSTNKVSEPIVTPVSDTSREFGNVTKQPALESASLSIQEPTQIIPPAVQPPDGRGSRIKVLIIIVVVVLVVAIAVTALLLLKDRGVDESVANQSNTETSLVDSPIEYKQNGEQFLLKGPTAKGEWEVYYNRFGDTSYEDPGKRCSVVLQERDGINALVSAGTVSNTAKSVARYHGEENQRPGLPSAEVGGYELVLPNEADSSFKHTFEGVQYLSTDRDGDDYNMFIGVYLFDDKELVVSTVCAADNWEAKQEYLDDLMSEIKVLNY